MSQEPSMSPGGRRTRRPVGLRTAAAVLLLLLAPAARSAYGQVQPQRTPGRPIKPPPGATAAAPPGAGDKSAASTSGARANRGENAPPPEQPEPPDDDSLYACDKARGRF